MNKKVVQGNKTEAQRNTDTKSIADFLNSTGVLIISPK